MGNGNRSRASVSKISAAAAPASSATTKFTSKSSILRSSFAPSSFQLALFASVIQGFDSQQLRFHDTITGRLRCEHAIAPKVTVSCLDWGFYGKEYGERHHKDLKKKRKRTKQANGVISTDDAQDVVLAFGTSDSIIHLYSPTKAKVVGLLKEVHTQGIRDFRFVDGGRRSEGWSVGGDGKLVHWDLQKCKSTKTVSLPDPSARTLCPIGSSVLCASHKALLINPESSTPTTSFTASNNILHSIIASSAQPLKPLAPKSFLSAAENDRFINVFDVERGSPIGSLVAESDVMKIAVALGDGNIGAVGGLATELTDLALGAITRDGILELFESPFMFGSSSAEKDVESLKARMKRRTRKASALVKIVRPDKSTGIVPLLDAVFQDHELVLVWAEGGVDLRFDRVQWRKHDAADVVLDGIHEVTRGKATSAVGAVVMNGVKNTGKMHVDESQAVVTTGDQHELTPTPVEKSEVINISSGEEGSDYEDDGGDEDKGEGEVLVGKPSQASSKDDPLPETVSQKGRTPSQDIDVTMRDAPKEDNDAGEESAGAGADEPSFGELIRASASGPVDVQAAFAVPDAQALAPVNDRPSQLPSGISLSTVLTQSLRTNDVSLLETCLHVRDLAIVRNTIERLDSSLTSTLMQKLAERFHSRPGRAGSLLIWIQWTLVAHGGYLASQPGAMKTLAALHRVISERARSLPLLLSLKGKLDMLESQMNLRASMQARSKAQLAADEHDDEDVIYIEGQEEDESDDEGRGSNAEIEPFDSAMGIDETLDSGENAVSDKEVSVDEDEEMPTTMANGGLTDSEGEGSGSSGEELFDEEAESTDQDSGDEGSTGEVDHEDVDSMESDASSEVDEVPAPKRPATARLNNGIRSKK